jgi:hypothetical protein
MDYFVGRAIPSKLSQKLDPIYPFSDRNRGPTK